MRYLRLAATRTLAVPACGGAGPGAAPAPRDWVAYPAIADVPAPDVLYAASDVHGGYDRFVALLAAQQVIDGVPTAPDVVRWASGSAVLVVSGDLIDKGPKGLEVIDALRALEADAAAQGGRVVVLTGNHEAEFFVDPENSKADGNDGIDRELRVEHLDPAALAGGADPRGAWLRQRPLGARVGAWFFSHAGNTKGRSLAELEAALEAALGGANGYADAEIMGSDSLLEARRWYDGDDGIGGRYAAALGAKHIVFGHDPHALGPRVPSPWRRAAIPLRSMGISAAPGSAIGDRALPMRHAARRGIDAPMRRLRRQSPAAHARARRSVAPRLGQDSAATWGASPV